MGTHPTPYIETLCGKLKELAALAQAILREKQTSQKQRYVLQVQPWVLEPGQWVLLLLPTTHNKLTIKWQRTLLGPLAGGRGRLRDPDP